MHVTHYILLTKTTVAQNEDALSYHKVRGLYFLAVVFVRSICSRDSDALRVEDIMIKEKEGIIAPCEYSHCGLRIVPVLILMGH